MIRRLVKGESGYSLVEVMAAIMILSIAIIPMVGMFDAGLRAAVVGGNYDRGRALASEELAEIQALPFSRPSTPAADSVVEIYPPVNGTPAGTQKPCTGTMPSGLTCQVRTTYVRQDPATSSIIADANVRTMAEAVVTVRWDGGSKSYTTTGLVSKRPV